MNWFKQQWVRIHDMDFFPGDEFRVKYENIEVKKNSIPVSLLDPIQTNIWGSI